MGFIPASRCSSCRFLQCLHFTWQIYRPIAPLQYLIGHLQRMNFLIPTPIWLWLLIALWLHHLLLILARFNPEQQLLQRLPTLMSSSNLPSKLLTGIVEHSAMGSFHSPEFHPAIASANQLQPVEMAMGSLQWALLKFL